MYQDSTVARSHLSKVKVGVTHRMTVKKMRPGWGNKFHRPDDAGDWTFLLRDDHGPSKHVDKLKKENQ